MQRRPSGQRIFSKCSMQISSVANFLTVSIKEGWVFMSASHNQNRGNPVLCQADNHHAELRRLAHRQMGRERAGHSLQTTALVNEAYLRLVDCNRMRWVD